METRRLGRTDIRIPVLSLGTMTWGRQNSEADGHAQMDLALDRGLTLFDAAEMYPIPRQAETYGRTEEIIGSWFAARPGAREKVLLATKLHGRSEETWLREGGRPTRVTPTQIEEAVEKSLKRLRTDRIDLSQVHWPDRPMPRFGGNPTVFEAPPEVDDETPIAVQCEAMDRLVKAGKVRHIGVSNESAWGVMQWLKASEGAVPLPRIESLQNAYSLVNRTFETALAEIALREDVGLLAYSVLAQGYLTGKYRDGALPPGARKTLFHRLQRYEGPGTETAVDLYLDLAAEAGLDPAQMAIRFVTTRPFVTTVLLGATSVEQLERDIAAAEVRLPADVLTEIDIIHRGHASPAP
jgi:aryl-alcohol dehydrogenase-like predicted oxidoreductase